MRGRKEKTEMTEKDRKEPETFRHFRYFRHFRLLFPSSHIANLMSVTSRSGYCNSYLILYPPSGSFSRCAPWQAAQLPIRLLKLVETFSISPPLAASAISFAAAWDCCDHLTASSVLRLAQNSSDFLNASS